MLRTDQLHIVIKQAQRDADVCTRFCGVGAKCGESGYTIHHNGLGPSDTGEQRVYARWVLRLPEHHLTLWLAAWLIATHNGQHFDLNASPRDRHVP